MRSVTATCWTNVFSECLDCYLEMYVSGNVKSCVINMSTQWVIMPFVYAGDYEDQIN